MLRPNPGLLNDDVPIRECYTKRWRQAQHLANVFWKRWKAEYFPALRLTHKWLLPQRDLKQGDLILIQKPDGPRSYWPIGLVEETSPGEDERVRKVSVRTTHKRDVKSLCPLEGILEAQ